MSKGSRHLAGILLIVFPTVLYGGASLLHLLVTDPAYIDNQLQQDLWRAGHAKVGVFMILSLVVLRFVDEAHLSERSKKIVRHLPPLAAVLFPAAFFPSVLPKNAHQGNDRLYFVYAGAILLATALIWVGVGPLRRSDAANRVRR